MRYGFVVPNNFGVADPRELGALGVLAEELGFDSVWVNHHVLNLGYVADRLGHGPYHDALVTLTWLASQTQQVTLGTSVLVMPYLHPMVLAKELATLDHLCGGRLQIGLGVGSLPEENAALGSPYTSRGAYSNEFIQVLRGLWSQMPFSFSGDHFQFSDVVSSPQPLQVPNPKLVIGGNRKVALRRVAQLGDGWHCLGLSPASVAKRLPILDQYALAAGRPDACSLIQVRTDMSRLTPDMVDDYAALGVTDLVLSLSTGDVVVTRHALQHFAEEFSLTPPG